MVKSTSYSRRGPRVCFQHLHGGPQLPGTSVLGDLRSSSDFLRHQAGMWCTNMRGKTFVHIKENIFKETWRVNVRLLTDLHSLPIHFLPRCPSTHPPTHPSKRLLTHLSIHAPLHQPAHSPMHLFTSTSIHLSFCPPTYPFTHPHIHPSTHPFIHRPTHLSIPAFIHAFTHLSSHLPTQLFIHPRKQTELNPAFHQLYTR